MWKEVITMEGPEYLGAAVASSCWFCLQCATCGICGLTPTNTLMHDGYMGTVDDGGAC
jgi:hypothetical protein